MQKNTSQWLADSRADSHGPSGRASPNILRPPSRSRVLRSLDNGGPEARLRSDSRTLGRNDLDFVATSLWQIRTHDVSKPANVATWKWRLVHSEAAKQESGANGPARRSQSVPRVDCHMDVATDGVRKASQSRASDWPSPGECRESTIGPARRRS